MKLVKIDAEDVTNHPENYNSYFHNSYEAPAFTVPTETPQYYTRWLPLIASSQRIPPHLIQTKTLTPTQIRLLISAAQASLQTHEVNRLYAEEIADTIMPSLSTLTYPPQGLFLRVDLSSPKDCVGGIKPLRTFDEVLLCLTTSQRAVNAFTQLLEEGAEEVRLYFLPFDREMSTEREFRVFCPPGEGSISVVSQYKWYSRSVFAGLGDGEIEQVLEKVFWGIQEVHGEILKVVREREDELDGLMLGQGFSFDVTWDREVEECRLIELNSFGKRSGCGSCLFHWLRDGDLLYGGRGGEKGQVEFRISV